MVRLSSHKHCLEVTPMGSLAAILGKSNPTHDAMTADAIAKTYMAILNQPKGAWSWEMEIRSKDEHF